MILSYDDEEDLEEETEEYYDNLSGGSWSTTEVGTWKDLE